MVFFFYRNGPEGFARDAMYAFLKGQAFSFAASDFAGKKPKKKEDFSVLLDGFGNQMYLSRPVVVAA